MCKVKHKHPTCWNDIWHMAATFTCAFSVIGHVYIMYHETHETKYTCQLSKPHIEQQVVMKNKEI